MVHYRHFVYYMKKLEQNKIKIENKSSKSTVYFVDLKYPLPFCSNFFSFNKQYCQTFEFQIIFESDYLPVVPALLLALE